MPRVLPNEMCNNRVRQRDLEDPRQSTKYKRILSLDPEIPCKVPHGEQSSYSADKCGKPRLTKPRFRQLTKLSFVNLTKLSFVHWKNE